MPNGENFADIRVPKSENFADISGALWVRVKKSGPTLEGWHVASGTGGQEDVPISDNRGGSDIFNPDKVGKEPRVNS